MAGTTFQSLPLPVERPADSSLQKMEGAQEMTEVLGDKNLEAERLVTHDELQGKVPNNTLLTHSMAVMVGTCMAA